MRLRPAPLRAAAALAVGFVAVRVVYRVLFHGADGAGPVVLPLPLFRLAPPFAHVQVLGPVTLDGLRDAVLSALPIALTLLGFGVLNALLDLPALLARAAGRGPLQGVARALSVAWATLPALADAVRAARFARRLRGERPGVRLLAPVLERTLERATAVAASLEVRGYGARHPSRPAHGSAPPALPSANPVGRVRRISPDADGCRDAYASQENLRVSRPPSAPVACRDAVAAQGVATVRLGGLTLDAGTLVLLTGATGSGKTTVLRALSGLLTHLDGGRIDGAVQVAGRDRAATPPRETASSVGVVLQQPREAFVADTVAHEIGLTLELRGDPASVRRARVAEVARRVGIEALLDRPVRALSAGEAVLTAIAGAIVGDSVLLLVDEPLADLDVAARERIVALLAGLAAGGACVVVAEHRAAEFAGVADVVLRIDGGEVGAVLAVHPAEVVVPGTDDDDPGRMSAAAARSSGPWGRHAPDSRHLGPDEPAPAPAPAPAAAAEDTPPADTPPTATDATDPRDTRPPVLTASGVTVRRGDRIVVDDARFALAPGEVVALTGPNGAGKSSLLAAIAVSSGRRDDDVRTAGPIALVPDVSDDLFVRDTVAAECRAADRRARRRPSDAAGRPRRLAAPRWLDGQERAADAVTSARFAALLRLDPEGPVFRRMLARHPRDLSAGERRCLAIALQTARRPAVLLVDEPTHGLDPAARALVARALAAQAAEGAAVLLATHDRAFVGDVCDRELPLRDGVLGAAPAAADDPLARSLSAATPAAASASVHNSGDSAPHAPAIPGIPGVAAPTPARSPELRTPPKPAPEAPPATPPAPAPPAAPRPTRPAPPATPPTPAPPAAPWPAPPAPAPRAPAHRTPASRVAARTAALIAANLAAAAAFLWPLVASAVPAQAQAAVPYIALSLAPVAAVLVVAALDRSVRSAHTLALLAVLAAIGAAIRIASTGVGGVEALFVLLILAGRAYGARFGLLLGAASLALSALVWGGVGPWLPFQMFACGWVGAGAGLLPRRVTGWPEIAMLCVYGVVASYVFGLIMNMWFWPFAVGSETSISYVPGGSIGENLANFLVYSLITSTVGWDTLRAVTTVVGLLLVGRAILAALRRAKPVAEGVAH